MNKLPEEITVCQLECILMPQGEIICTGKTLGWFKDFKKWLTPVEKVGVDNSDAENQEGYVQ